MVPLLVREDASDSMRALVGADAVLVVWWATETECVSAIARRERSGELDIEGAREALVTLDGLIASCVEVAPSERIRRDARRLVRAHDLRAADAFQLGAGRVASEDLPDTLPFVTLDDRLALAAEREGFQVVGA
jgi:hypothetical protein